ncbi:hypothetical protein LSH36_482g02055 [Paralvinella palmiformis]|uniref:FERM domain-containing protein n=1 Tax=Paralvinella palmiformis TaxID=53620 RepID=A0AAD9J9L7_9ANNE|nr:hypothetical protein LSH36_482g02055 [Paralvinella palmiformis]
MNQVYSELGDFLEDEYLDHTYLTQLKLLPQQNDNLLIKIMDHHREHVGQTPEQADFNLLDTARKVELYGIRMHPAKLAVAHMGVLVFQNYTKINTFSWAKIRKLSFKRKKFLIKLHPEGYGYYKDTVEFYFDSRNECKNFWKKCIEHHAFFRCHVVKKVPRNKTRVVSRGSSFRTTSLRTVSSTRSAIATPKTGTLNSRDIHFGRDANQNPSTSSGSHTIDMSRSNENMMDSTQAEVHDESFNSMSRRSRGSPRRDRSYDRSLNRSLERAHERAQNHYQMSPPMPPRRDDYQRQMEVDKGREDFNYSYYQITYDGQGTRDYPHGMGEQNANDNDEAERDFDNVSHDSYPLTESRDSLEGELDAPSGPLEGEVVAKLRSELEFRQREGSMEVAPGESEERYLEEGKGVPQSPDVVGESQQGLVGYKINSDLKLTNDECPLLGDEDLHVISVKPLESKDGKKQVEIQIVQKVETTHIVEKVERMNVLQHDGSLDNTFKSKATADESLELVRVEFESETDVLNNEKSNLEDAVVPPKGTSEEEETLDDKRELQNGDVKQEAVEKEQVKHAATNGADLNEEIPYYLHKRVVPPKSGDLVQLIRSRGRSPSPRRPQVVIPQTKEQEKAQLDKIKSGFTEPLSASHGVPLSPQSKSPGLKRAFDYVVYSKLPPPDSFSSVDDSLSPSLEKEIIAHIKSKIDSPSDADYHKQYPISDPEKEPERKKPKEEDHLEESMILVESFDADVILKRQCSSEMLDQDDESDSDQEEMTCLREPDVDEDINRLLSECGQDSRSISSVSDHDVFDDGDGGHGEDDVQKGANDENDDDVDDYDDDADDDDDDDDDDAPIKERVLPPGEELQKPPLLPRPPIEFDEREEDEYLMSARKSSNGKMKVGDDKFQDLPSPPPPPPPPPPVPEDDSSSLDDGDSPPPPPTICEIEDSEDENTTPFHPPALLAPNLSSPDEELTRMSPDMLSSAGGLDIPAICIRAATPIDSPASDDSPSANIATASRVEPTTGDDLSAGEEGSLRESSPEFETEPLTVELHIDEDRLMHDLAVEEALELGRVALSEGETEESALQRVGAALAEKALREALIQASLIDELRNPRTTCIMEVSDSSGSLDGDVLDHHQLPPSNNVDYFSDSDADVEHPVSEDHTDAMDILRESARVHPFEVLRPGDEKKVMFTENDTSSEEEVSCEESPKELTTDVVLDEGSVQSHDISPDDNVHYDVELERGELLEALAEEARRKSFCLPLSGEDTDNGEDTDPSTPEQDISPEQSTHCEDDLELDKLTRALAEEAQEKPFTSGPLVLAENISSSSYSSSLSSNVVIHREDANDKSAFTDQSIRSRPPPPILPKPKVDKRILGTIDGSATELLLSSSDQPQVGHGLSGTGVGKHRKDPDEFPYLADTPAADSIGPDAVTTQEESPGCSGSFPPPPPLISALQPSNLDGLSDSSESDGDVVRDDVEDDLDALERLDAAGMVRSSSEDDVDLPPPDGTDSDTSTMTALQRADDQPS